MNSRKGIHHFANQTEGVKYFTLAIIEFANHGWFATDEVKKLFRKEVTAWEVEKNNPNHLVTGFWGLVCFPILGFFSGVCEGSPDNSMSCNFITDIKRPKKTDKYIQGSMSWHSQHTQHRFIRLVFRESGEVVMYYDLGVGYDDEEGKNLPRQRSGFLRLPQAGDTDLSFMTHQDFLTQAEADMG